MFTLQHPTTNLPRSARDAYWTPPALTQALLEHTPELRGERIWEPCAGAGWMRDVLIEDGGCVVYASDVAPMAPRIDRWDFLGQSRPSASLTMRWIITNPPFVLALPILERALAMEGVAGVALLVRLTFLEPTSARAPLLSSRPPGRVIVLPRTRFPRPDGEQAGTDSVTCAWMIWGLEGGVRVHGGVQ